MKKLKKLLSLLLVTVMLLHSLIACTDNTQPSEENEKQPGNGEEMNNTSYIEANLSGWDIKKICDFSSDEFISKNGSVNTRTKEIDGKNGYLWEPYMASTLVFYIPEENQNVQDYYYYEFSIYTKQPTDATVRVRFANAGSTDIKLDFSGWKTFRVQTDNISVKNPYPKIYEVVYQLISGNATEIYLTEMVAKSPKYTLSVPDGIDLNDSEIYNKITDLYRECLVGPETPLDNDGYRAKATSMQNNGKNSWKLFKETSNKLDTPETLFNIKVYNIPYAGYGTPAINGGNIKIFYDNIYCMAQGYGVPGTELYKNPDLLADIITALDYGYEFYYGKDILQTGVTHGNWWEWDVGIPQSLTVLLTIISRDISPELITKYLSPFDKLMKYPVGTACNLVDMSRLVILSGVLQHNAQRICEAKEMMSEVFIYLDEQTEIKVIGDGGFYSDGSFIQHNGTPYTLGYGSSLINALTNVSYILKDSPFAMHGKQCDRQYEWIINGYRPFIYEGKFMSYLMGRSVSGTRSEASGLTSIVPMLIRMSNYAPDEYKDDILAIVKYAMQVSDVDFSSKVDYPLISFCEQIKNDDSITPTEPLHETLILASMDRIAQHNPEYAVGISLSSTRVFKYESINGANKAGWYHGDGMIYLYTDGYDYDNNYYWYVNPYLMPGTTVNNAPRVTACISPSIYNTSPYAGGVAQGKYGTVGFILGYPKSAGAFESDDAKNIRAKKSYFLFDNEIVCIGTDIYDVSGTGARTVVENRLWKDGDVLSANGVSIAPATVETAIEARTMHFTGMGGYVFLDNNKILYSKATHSYNNTHNDIKATGTRDFLEISLSHGDGDVADGYYTYVYLPEASVQKTEEYSTNPDIEIIARNTGAHAVLEKNLGVIGCNFFNNKGGDITNINAVGVTKISAKNECSLIITKNADNSYTISASDPTQINKSLKITLAINGITEVLSTDTGVTATVSGGVATLTFNTAGARGATFDVTVK